MKWLVLATALIFAGVAPYFARNAMDLHKDNIHRSLELAYWVDALISLEAFLFFTIWFFVWHFSRS